MLYSGTEAKCSQPHLFRKENQMFGLPLTTCFWLFGYTGLALIGTLIYALSGNYEGKSTEEKYHLDDWYNTF